MSAILQSLVWVWGALWAPSINLTEIMIFSQKLIWTLNMTKVFGKLKNLGMLSPWRHYDVIMLFSGTCFHSNAISGCLMEFKFYLRYHHSSMYHLPSFWDHQTSWRHMTSKMSKYCKLSCRTREIFFRPIIHKQIFYT